MPDYGLGNKLFPAGLRACGDGGKEEEMNTWPGGHRHAMYQSEHEKWNAHNYPGTRQLCVECDQPTGRCEDDSLFTDNGNGPFCPECWSDKEEEMKQKRWLLMEVPEEFTRILVDCIGDGKWRTSFEVTDKILNGPVELVKEACEKAGVVWSNPKKGQYAAFDEGYKVVWEKATGDNYVLTLVIPAPEPEPKECQNCQGIKPGQAVDYTVCTHYERCNKCGKPAHEWTYALDINDNPEYAPGGIL